jgi:hypothetical protein
MDVLARIIVWLNGVANALGGVLLAPVAALPGWLSATLVSALTGVLLLVLFKYTSAQRAIRRVRNDINAHLLALKLFKDSASVAVRAQGRVLLGAGRLLVLALVPMLVMLVPVCLMLGQLGLWYQARPLHVGEKALVTVQLHDNDAGRPDVALEPSDAVEVTVGPVWVRSKHEVCWKIRACRPGYHSLNFLVGGQAVEKELAIGEGYMRVSAERPGWTPSEVLRHPWERPFEPDSPVQSIQIDYPRRDSWTSGTDLWVAYWFVVSMIAAFCLRPWLNVNV